MLLSNGLSGPRGALQLTPADELNLTVPLIDQGADSLSAVTVGSWFTQEPEYRHSPSEEPWR
jgi:hypothetical protein